MRTFIALCLTLLSAPIGCDDATPAEACDNVETVCKGNPDFERLNTACQVAVSDANQDIVNCLGDAQSCGAASQCVPEN